MRGLAKRGLDHWEHTKLRLRFLRVRLRSREDCHRFRCNICGRVSVAPMSAVKDREARSCYHCGSNRRFRSIVAALSREVFGRIMPLPEFRTEKAITGIGMSDDAAYAVPLSRKLAYRNTYYDREPRLDITSIGDEMHASCDFVIASDVFEHVPPPVEIGFSNLYRMLKADGVCIFSVPYSNAGETHEHFPDLFDFRIVTRNGKMILINRARDGLETCFEDLRFHGGPGLALEMRVFARSSLLEQITRAGFGGIEFYRESVPEHGILIDDDASGLVMALRKGRRRSGAGGGPEG